MDVLTLLIEPIFEAGLFNHEGIDSESSSFLLSFEVKVGSPNGVGLFIRFVLNNCVGSLVTLVWVDIGVTLHG